ncbi:AMP phosphorylase [Desulfurococcus mucosus]|uniref:AMP phosphorylase n=1 Tax=Desulfurococcus mucosus (strain ATCC 35584 / DSM 2162 / JCM 9187 / O7/1) TaxID=765177 RepID=E8R7Y4_DESM0|nr:AMP phosphorylase [Desulfurococcus mucosus]ADV64610.1 AMP phosphorylase [Desulfurococcus mucosus DSM 2162]
MGLEGRPKLFEVRVVDIDLHRNLIIMNTSDARELGVVANNVVLVTLGDKSAYATVVTSETITQPGVVALSKQTASALGVSEGDKVGVKPVGLPASFNALKKRLHGGRLSEGEMKSIIRDVVDGVYGEAEIAAFLVSQLYSELGEEELSYLIKAMVETGSRVTFEETVYDVHSIGGVPGNSKVALLTVPIVAASGLLIPKTSSRAITSPAGTADTMEVLARVDLTMDEIVEIARRVKGVLAWGGKLNLAPADDIFVNIERRLSIDPDQQMVASILSKKIAMGVERLVIDMPVGRGAKVKDASTADKLAGLFIRQAGLLGLSIKVALTYGGQPIGTTAGPALEAREALEALIERKGSRSLIDKAVLLAGLVLELSGRAQPGQGEDIAREVFLSGKAYEKFKQIVEAQGGNPNVKPDDIQVGSHTFTLSSPLEGAVTHIDNAAVSLIARACGAPYDKGAGVRLHAKVGYRVNKGDPLITLYSSSASRLETAVRLLRDLNPVVVEGMLLKTLP